MTQRLWPCIVTAEESIDLRMDGFDSKFVGSVEQGGNLNKCQDFRSLMSRGRRRARRVSQTEAGPAAASHLGTQEAR